MQQVIFNYYLDGFGTYLLISQRVFHGVIRIQRENVVTLPHSAQTKHSFWGEIKEISKTKKLPSRKKIALELLHQRLGHRFTKLFLAGDTTNFWEDIEIIIDPEPFANHAIILP